MIADFHFLRPAWLLALIPMLLLLLWLRNVKSGRGVWHAVCDAHLIPFVLESASSSGRSRSLLLSGIAGVLAIVALAGPVWHKLPQPVFRQQSALVILLDLSRSMDAGDVKPSRLERARLKLLDLLQMRKEGQTALVVYAGDAFTVTPLTDDTDTISSLVQSLSTSLMPAQGSRSDRAVDQALDLLSRGGVRGGALLLVTDGIDESRVEEIAAKVVRSGHRLSVLATGTLDGAPIPDAEGGFVKDAMGQIVVPKLNEEMLVKLAVQGGGIYTPLRIQDDDIELLLRQFDAASDSKDVVSTQLQTDRWREEGPWLLLLLLPLATLAFRKGLLIAVICAGIHWPDSAVAMEWDDLWFNTNQRGVHEMEAENFAAAANRFSDTRWKAAALYRAGKYEEAAEQLEGMTDPEANYNRGTALARAGRIEEAIESFEEALEQRPDHADARHNLELLRQLKNQQQQQPGQSDNDEQEQPRQADSSQRQSGQDQQGQFGENGPSDQQSERNEDSEVSETGHQSAEPNSAEQDDGDTGQERSAGEQDSTSNGESNSDKGENEPGPPVQADSEPQQTEEQQAIEQWLRRVPDDPGGLLRRKFRHQYTQRNRNSGDEVRAW